MENLEFQAKREWTLVEEIEPTTWWRHRRHWLCYCGHCGEPLKVKQRYHAYPNGYRSRQSWEFYCEHCQAVWPRAAYDGCF